MAECGDVPDLHRNENEADDDDDDDSVDWNEIESSEEQSVTCLFCKNTFISMSDAIEHCKQDHGFDLVVLKKRFDMDCYSFIKLINYIRLHQADASFITNVKETVWEKDEYLKPVQIDDPWLMYDFEDIDVPSNLQERGNAYHVVNAENGCVTLSEQHFSELQKTIQRLSTEVREKDAMIENMLQDMERMRQVTHKLMEIGNDEETTISKEKCVKNISLSTDEGYFNTYAHFSIHHEMLSDVVRTSSYKKALTDNTELLQNSTLLDLGCGTGILSMFAASGGAKQVIGIDQSDVIYHAMEIVRENNLSDKIALIKGRIEDTSIPSNEVDIIVSEWMGYFLLFEGMLDSVIYARDQHLKKGGTLLPNRCSISLIGLADTARHSELIGFWSNVYGYRMSCLQREVVREPTIEVVPQHMVVTTPCILNQLDLYTCTVRSVDFTSDFSLQVMRDDTLTALVGYFDIFFDLPQPVSFSTGPHAAPTHWKQTVFFLEEPISVKQGDTISGKLICQRHIKDVRSLTVTIHINNAKYKYILS